MTSFITFVYSFAPPRIRHFRLLLLTAVCTALYRPQIFDVFDVWTAHPGNNYPLLTVFEGYTEKYWLTFSVQPRACEGCAKTEVNIFRIARAKQLINGLLPDQNSPQEFRVILPEITKIKHHALLSLIKLFCLFFSWFVKAKSGCGICQ